MVKITLTVPDEQALKSILARAKVSVEGVSFKREESGSMRITLYATAQEAAKITGLPFRSDSEEEIVVH